jgi:hypothetical protein
MQASLFLTPAYVFTPAVTFYVTRCLDYDEFVGATLHMCKLQHYHPVKR